MYLKSESYCTLLIVAFNSYDIIASIAFILAYYITHVSQDIFESNVE